MLSIVGDLFFLCPGFNRFVKGCRGQLAMRSFDGLSYIVVYSGEVLLLNCTNTHLCFSHVFAFVIIVEVR